VRSGAPTRLYADREGRDFDHRWHVALNYPQGKDGPLGSPSWMYEAKTLADEVGRLVTILGMERRGELPQHHHQCSRDATGEPVPDNHLTCCLGVECRKCEYLAVIERGELTPEEKDVAKAWTCATHIVASGGVEGTKFDTSEGFLLTTDDRMYWDNVYESLAAGDPDDDGSPHTEEQNTP